MPEGHTIHRLARRHQQLFAGQQVGVDSPQGRFAEGAALLDGHTLLAAEAWGKHLFHVYEGDLRVHVHLGLFGKFRDGARPAPTPRGALRMRLLGEERWLELRGPIACEVLTPAECDAVVARLGPDPLRPGTQRATDAAGAEVGARLARSRAPIGTLLMDQSVVAGVGNVYRAEVLFRHRVDPFIPGRDLDPAVWEAIWADLRVLMRAGVRAGRIVTTRPDDRERPHGRPRRVDAYYVYRRDGLPCRVCGTLVRRTELGNRNLFWCPTCQPAD